MDASLIAAPKQHNTDAERELSMSRGESDPVCLILLLVVWMVAALAVNPVGDFPLNDDWAYGSAVRTLVEDGDIRFSDWAAINLIAQVLWGAVFCLPFGFSFTALRVSTLVLGLVGILATYGLLREARARAGLALFGALALGFSPIYFSLSFSFMSDVPFAAIATASSWFLLRGLRRDSPLEIASGLACAGGAILIRQVGLALPIAFAVAYIVRYGLGIRRLLESMLPVAAGFALQIGYETWLRRSDRLPASFGSQYDSIQGHLHQAWESVLAGYLWGVRPATTITLYSLVYIGFFLFPFLVAVQRSIRFRWSAITSVALIGIATTTTGILKWGKLMPLYFNILQKGGVDCCDGDPSQAPEYFWVFVTFIGILGALLLVQGLLRSVFPPQKDCGERYILTFALAAILTSFAPLLLLLYFWDRYLIVFLPWLMLAIVASDVRSAALRPPKFAAIVGAITSLGISAFSVAATHDYLSANRVRWAALNRLLNEHGVKPEQIEGGFAFDGLYLYPSADPRIAKRNDYLVSYYQYSGYTTLEKFDVPRWLPWGHGEIIVSKSVWVMGTR